MVLGNGPKDALIVIVGESPGATEEETGIPFTGSSGHLLDLMLSRAGILRSSCYITNVSKDRPKDNNFGVFYEKGKTPKPELVKLWEDLKKEISEIKPNVIIALGGEALRALTGKMSIEHWRGSVLNTDCGKVIGTYHPAFILRSYEHRPIAELDLGKAKRESLSPDFTEDEYHFILSPTITDVLNYLSKPIKRLSFDIETCGERVRCLGFASSPYEAICIPFMKAGGGSFYTLEEEYQILQRLNEVFLDEHIEKIAQNFPFDSSFLCREFGFEIKGLWMDTMIAQHCCYCELPKALDFLCSIYTRIPYYSDYDVKNDESVWTYNSYDVVTTFQVAEKLETEMKELNVYDFYRNHCQPLMLSLAKAGNRGVLIDLEMRDRIKLEKEKELVDIKGQIKRQTGLELNPNSPKQMKDYFHVQLKLDRVISRSTHKDTLNEEALESLAAKYPHIKPLIENILEYRGIVKLIGTFLSSGLLPNNRMPTSYNATGTVEGRISSSKTILGLGGDLQNVPRGEFRRMFIAPKGKSFIKADASQADARAVAYFANIRGLIENFKNPKFDVHKWNASIIFSKPEESITASERQVSKSLVHAANYNIGVRTAARLSGLTVAQAREKLDAYYRALPEIKMWWERIKGQLFSTRKLTNPFGRIRIFFGRMNDETFRSAYAFLPASTASGDNINQAFYRLEERLLKISIDCYPVLQVHDEIVSEVLDDKIDECIPIIRSEMELEIKTPQFTLKIPAEIKVGKNWYDMVSINERQFSS